MKRAIKSLPGRLPVEVEEVSLGSRPKYLVRVIEPSEASVAPSSGPG